MSGADGLTLRETSVTCTACACLCDDLRIEHDGQQILSTENACRLAEPWLMSMGRTRPVAAAAIEGQETSIEAALDHAAELLSESRAPLIYGLSRSSTPGQRAAVALAEQIGACIDTTASVGHASSVMAVQQQGEQTCSLGEVKNRADLVIYWGSDPEFSHPRHRERYTVLPQGEFISGPEERHVVVIDIRPTATSATANQFIPIAPRSDFEVLWLLQALAKGTPGPFPANVGGVDLVVWQKLAERMKQCRFGIVFFGYGLSRTGLGHHNVEALLRLVRELNDYTRFYARRMRVVGDVTGADLVLAWQTGYPFSVNLSRGYPRYNPGEYSAWGLLEREEVDCCLLVGSESLPRLPLRAQTYLRQIPTIVLDHPHVQIPFAPTVQITTGVYGVHWPGTAYRMDEVPLPLKGYLSSNYPTDEAVLEGMTSRLKSIRRA